MFEKKIMTVDIGFGGSCFKACTLFLGWLFFWDGYKLGEVFILCHVLQVVFFFTENLDSHCLASGVLNLGDMFLINK